jgi:5-methylcytosine-specific restriction endonuclease McrA
MEKYYLIPEELIERKILIVLDSRRKINRSDRELLLNKQRGLCYIDGNKLMLEDAEAGHIIPHSEGGSTSLDNIVMIRRIHNSKMGSMNVETYKEMYQRRSNV